MRVLIDYRPALRERSGVGEYTHELARALLQTFPADATSNPLALTLFSSSWKDRFVLPADLAGADAIDRRIPVALLNLAWHRAGWPPVEMIASRAFDVTHSLHPLLLPARDAAHVVTIHDLNFMLHPERTRAEIARDYASLAAEHARRADAVIAVSPFTAREIERLLGVPADRISICPAGAPPWTPRTAKPADGGYLLFFGTLEPRKNVGGLLDAYELLLARRQDLPPLMLAGGATEAAQPWLDRIDRAPLRGNVHHMGYIEPSARRALYDGARLLVQPSFEEGFGLTVLEAMTAGVPVVAANRGSLPELLDGAGLLVEPDDPEAIAAAIDRMLDDDAQSASGTAKGIRRAADFTWPRTAAAVYATYQLAISRRCGSA